MKHLKMSVSIDTWIYTKYFSGRNQEKLLIVEMGRR